MKLLVCEAKVWERFGVEDRIGNLGTRVNGEASWQIFHGENRDQVADLLGKLEEIWDIMRSNKAG